MPLPHRSTEYDATIAGTGPNGLVAAVTLARAGWRVLAVEAAPTPGGGTRPAALTRPGLGHDVCSAIHPLGVASEAMRNLPLADHGLEWVQPEIAAGHPLDGGRAGLLYPSLDRTVAGLGTDGEAYRRLLGPLVRQDLVDSLLSPLSIPSAPVALARYGLAGILPLDRLARSRFSTDEAKALLAGLAAHSMLSLRSPITAGYGLMLGLLGHLVGWPMAKGGPRRSPTLVSLPRPTAARSSAGVPSARSTSSRRRGQPSSMSRRPSSL